MTRLNIVGLRCSGMSDQAIAALGSTFRIVYNEGRTLRAAVECFEADFGQVPELQEFVAFVRSSAIGINPARESDRCREL